jgi:hypothetical protein
MGLLALGVAACHRSCSYSGSTSVSFGSDAGALALAPPSPVDAAVEASSDAGGVPSRFAGVFHLAGPDETNLALDPSGTFHWRVFDCLYVRASCGQWVTKGNLVVLTPSAAEKTLVWVRAGSLIERVTRVDVAEHDGRLEMRAYLPDGTSFAQVWSPGQVCNACGDGGGPSLAPCNTPFPSTCP